MLVFSLRCEPSKGHCPLGSPVDPATDVAGVRRGVRGEGSEAAGSPRSYTAENTFMD